jgi:hypothetical protein
MSQTVSAEEIRRYIESTFEGVDVVTNESGSGTFFSIDVEKHWPNFATIVTTDEFDMGTPADLSRPGVYRLNIGLGRASFDRLVGDIEAPDYAALDRVLPHPVYAPQLWVAILNPSDDTFRDVVLPLLTEAHDRLAAARARHAGDGPTS